MGMTIIEKILARAGGLEKVAGGRGVVDVDISVMIDLSFNPSGWREILEVHDPDKVVVVYDHRVPAADRGSAAAQMIGREFVKKFGIKRFHDVGPEQGISNVVVAERGYARPGTVLVCGDSHACSGGTLHARRKGRLPQNGGRPFTRPP